MNLKNTIFIAIIILFILELIVTKQDAKNEQNILAKPTIALSTFSLYDITKNIVGNSAEPFIILPLGKDAHSYKPTPKEVIKLYKSDLVVYSGAGLEPWIDGFEFKSKAIDMSLHVKLKNLDEHHRKTHQSEKDPHYWLDIDNMITATKVITTQLIKLFPKNSSLYIKNRDTYIQMLKKLDKEYTEKLSTCKLDTIVVNHNAFSYLSSRYGFKVQSLSGFSPEAQPSAKTMQKLIKYVKQNHTSTIFYESFASDRAIKSVADEADVKVDVLQPLGNITADELKQNLSYKDIMKQNLGKISKALHCK